MNPAKNSRRLAVSYAAIARRISSAIVHKGSAIAGGRFLLCEKGATLVEFAFAIPVLLVLLSGIISTGSVMYVQGSMETAARTAARSAAAGDTVYVGTSVLCSSGTAQAAGHSEKVACDALPSLGFEYTVNVSDLCPGTQNVVVVITANGAQIAMADIYGVFDGSTLTSRLVMRREASC